MNDSIEKIIRQFDDEKTKQIVARLKALGIPLSELDLEPSRKFKKFRMETTSTENMILETYYYNNGIGDGVHLITFETSTELTMDGCSTTLKWYPND